jgi:hypothetical protein
MNSLLSPLTLSVAIHTDIYLRLQLFAVFNLFFLLVVRELNSNIQQPFARAVWRVSLVGIAPLIYAFVLILLWHLSSA